MGTNFRVEFQLKLASCNNFQRWIAKGTHQEHVKGGLSASVKLLLVIVLLVCSIVFAVMAIIKARSLEKVSDAWALKLTAFQCLDFTSDNVLDCLKEDNIIGKGGAWVVYKGVMPNGNVFAIKRLSARSRGSSHDHGFNAEIQTLGKIRHRHIVRLLGFCSNHETNLLVYEYMPNGSLGEVLHGKKGGHLHWDTRYKIAVGAAKGLCYPHHDFSPLIVHRDVKSNHILIDSDFEAHVADFGFAKFLQDLGTSECMYAIAGSYGYIAPVHRLVLCGLTHLLNGWSYGPHSFQLMLALNVFKILIVLVSCAATILLLTIIPMLLKVKLVSSIKLVVCSTLEGNKLKEKLQRKPKLKGYMLLQELTMTKKSLK